MYWMCKECKQSVNVSILKQGPQRDYICYICESKKKAKRKSSNSQSGKQKTNTDYILAHQ